MKKDKNKCSVCGLYLHECNCEKKNEDNVNYPKHYTFGKYEVIDVLDDWFPINPYEWQIVKYVSRAKHKGNELQDLKKAQWYLNRLVNRLEKEK